MLTTIPALKSIIETIKVASVLLSIGCLQVHDPLGQVPSVGWKLPVAIIVNKVIQIQHYTFPSDIATVVSITML